MTIDQAFEKSAMEGVAITHRYFTEEEFIQVLTNNNIKTEEGYTVSMDEFLKYRQEDEWKTCWEVF